MSDHKELIERAKRWQTDPANTAPSGKALLRNLINALEQSERTISEGTRELRAYVERNGFDWQENGSTVLNVTTAISLLGGALEDAKRKVGEARREALQEAKDAIDPQKRAYVLGWSVDMTLREAVKSIQFLIEEEQPSDAEDKFMILSRKWTKGDLCVWYRPNSNGYTSDINEAGIYSSEEAKRLTEPFETTNLEAVPLPRVRESAVEVVSVNLCNALWCERQDDLIEKEQS